MRCTHNGLYAHAHAYKTHTQTSSCNFCSRKYSDIQEPGEGPCGGTHTHTHKTTNINAHTGILATQSNDLAVGLPILRVLYAQSNPVFPLLLYVIAPISLVVINPVAFCLCGELCMSECPLYEGVISYG